MKSICLFLYVMGDIVGTMTIMLSYFNDKSNDQTWIPMYMCDMPNDKKGNIDFYYETNVVLGKLH